MNLTFSRGMVVLAVLSLLLTACGGVAQVAIGDNNTQVATVEKHIVSNDTVSIIVFGILGVLLILMCTVGFGAR